jgi:hypothetical protein
MHFMGQLAAALTADFICLYSPRNNKVVVFSQTEWPIWASCSAGY